MAFMEFDCNKGIGNHGVSLICIYWDLLGIDGAWEYDQKSKAGDMVFIRR
jgi:hypothetical protein